MPDQASRGLATKVCEKCGINPYTADGDGTRTDCFLPKRVSKGPVSIVVTSAMITSMVKIRGVRMPRS